MARSRLRTALTHAVGSGRITAKVIGVMERSVNVTLPNGAHMSNVPMIGGPAVIGQPVSIVKIEGETFALVAGIGQAADAGAATISTIVRSNSSEISDATDGGLDLSKILLIKSAGGTDEYAATDTGFNSALSAGTSGDEIWLPPKTITCTSKKTVPDGAGLFATDRRRTVLDFDMDGEVAVELGSLCSMSDITVDYNNTAGAGSLSCLIIDCAYNYGAAVEYIRDVTVIGTLANGQSELIGIEGYLKVGLDHSRASLENIEINLSGDLSSGIYGTDLMTDDHANAEGHIIFDNVHAKVKNTGTGYGHTGLMINFAGGSRDPVFILYNCTGEAESTNVLSDGETCGIETYSDVRLYNCHGRAVTAGTEQAIGIGAWSDASILVSCHGYGECDNSHSIGGFAAAGIEWSGGYYLESGSWRWDSYMFDCYGEGYCPGSGNGVGIMNGSYGYDRAWDNIPVPLIACKGVGNDYDFATSGDVRLGLQACEFEKAPGVVSGGTAVWEFPWGDRDANHVQTITTDTTLKTKDYTVIVDASGGDVTVTLPAVANSKHKRYTIKRIDSSANVVTIDGNGSETIDDQTTQTLAQYDALRIECDGSEWWIT